MHRSLLLAARVLVTFAGLGLTGCQFEDLSAWVPGAGGAGGALPSGGAPSCDHDCVPPPEGWSSPVLFGAGAFTEVPACPDEAPLMGIELYSGLEAAPILCPVCQCAGSETGCSLPEAWMVSAADCAGAAGATSLSFDAPPGWDGGCWPDEIAGGAQCGGVPCVQSITVSPPEVTASLCAPQAIGRPYPPPPSWARRGRECVPAQPGACPQDPETCRPPAGFALCVHRAGEHACPQAYPRREVFHREHEDARTCSTCECGPPEGNACTVLATAYQDAACGAVAGALLVTSETGGGCVDVPPGLELGAKSAEIVATASGACAPSGGQPSGTVTPSHPVTVCCRPDLVPE